MALQIPSTMSEVTPEWLTAALREGGAITHANVIAAPRETIGAGVGILGELARITLSYDRSEANAPRTVIAKIPTADPGGRGIASALGFYETEMRFYAELCSKNPIPTAKCYYGNGDAATTSYILLLEDLAGCPIGDQIAGCGIEQARLVIDQLAALHATFYDAPELKDHAWLPAINSPSRMFVSVAYAQAIGPFLEKFGDRLTPAQRDLAINLGPRIASVQNVWATGPQTICHGDARLDNIFFGSPDGSAPMTIIDWQIAGTNRGPYDVGYFMSQSVDPTDRKAFEEELLRGYHAKLAELGVKDYSWEQCWEDYRVSVLFCLCYPVVAGGSIDLANERGVTLAHAMLDRCITAITDLDGASLLEQFPASA